VMFAITLGAWCGALLVAKLLRLTVIRGASTPFVMELPPYRLPTFKGLAIHTWERTGQYLKKAGTVILSVSIILWALMTFPALPDSQRLDYQAQRRMLRESAGQAVVAEMESAGQAQSVSLAALALSQSLLALDHHEAEAGLKYSVAGRLGTALENLSQWAGFDWRTNIALIGGFAAKEVIVSTLGTAYSLGEVDPQHTASLASTLSRSPHWRPLTALSLMVFVMFYSPCFVALVCIVKESGAWKWGAFAMLFNTALAFLLSVFVFQAGRLLGF